MKNIALLFVIVVLNGCASSADKAAQEQAQKEQLQLALTKIDIECRDRYPIGTPGAMIKRKQCQQVGIKSMPLPKS